MRGCENTALCLDGPLRDIGALACRMSVYELIKIFIKPENG
jgi:hypothetical protein